MSNHVFRFHIKGWRLVIANCPVKIKKNRNIMTGWQRREIKRKALEKSWGRCQCCGKPLEYKECEMHHVLPVSLAPELATAKSNIIIVCHDCHIATHSNPFVYAKQIMDYYPHLAESNPYL